jgi:hypothetical protein
MVHKIAQDGRKAGIKIDPMNASKAAAKMAKDEGHNPKKAAVNAVKKI